MIQRMCSVPQGRVNLLNLAQDASSISVNLIFFVKNSRKTVILRACDFFGLFVFSPYPTSCISSPPTKPSS